MGYTLTLLSAVIYFYSFPPHTNGYSAFLSLTPFYFALSKTVSIKKAAILGSIWGITLSVFLSTPLFNALITEYELSTLFSTALIIISVYLPYGIIYGLYGISFKFLSERSGIYFPLAAASLWTLIDYMMSVLPFFIPWGFAGYTQVFNKFIQLSDISGIYGVTFLVVLINGLFTGIVLFKKKYIQYSISIIIIILSVVIYSNVRIHQINEIINTADNTKIKAAVIQGNFRSNDKWDKKNTAVIINTYVNMTKKIMSDADIIVWPETVLNSSDKYNLEVLTGISSLLKTNQIFVSGAIRNDGKNIYNSILTAGSTGLNYIYDKKILFPFTETSFSGLSTGQFIDAPAVFERGKSKPAYKTELTTFGFTICLESIYPDYVRKIKNLGTGILINVANDSWFGNTYEPHMQLYSIIARAIENRFYIIRSSNSGISAVISPSGEILNSIQLNSRDTIISSISIVNISSIYSKYGDWIILLSLIILIFFLVYHLKFQE